MRFFYNLILSRFAPKQLKDYRIIHRPLSSGGFLLTTYVKAVDWYEAARAFDTDPRNIHSVRISVNEIS